MQHCWYYYFDYFYILFTICGPTLGTDIILHAEEPFGKIPTLRLFGQCVDDLIKTVY